MAEGIKETMEALQAVNALSIELFKAAKDGLGVGDAVKIASNPEIIAKVVAAVEGVGKIPTELKDLDAIETQQLVAVLTSSIGQQLAAVGVQPDNRIVKILPLMSEYAALGQKTFDALTK